MSSPLGPPAGSDLLRLVSRRPGLAARPGVMVWRWDSLPLVSVEAASSSCFSLKLFKLGCREFGELHL